MKPVFLPSGNGGRGAAWRRALTPLWLAILVVSALAACPEGARATPSHGIAMYGDPALPPDFVSLPYANPKAPKGGRIVFAEAGGFDSLNPYSVKGRFPWALPSLTVETLMARSYDEPFSLYGLLAESVETDEARSWVEFTLRPEARFSDGSPVTVEDVIWSYETLGTGGNPRYTTSWQKVAKIEQTGPRKIRITFTQPDRELALLMGLRPVLKKAQWQGRSLDDSGLEAPLGSGPYTVAAFEPGRYISFRRNPDYWGKDLPITRGLNNFDEIRYDYFADAGVIPEALKAGDVTYWAETSAQKWATQYDFPAVASGEVVKSEIPRHVPAGIQGLAMNTRLPVFADWRVREAMILAFNFDFINLTINGGTEPRIASYFANSTLGMQPGPATGRVAELLAPFAAGLPPGTLEGYALPEGSQTDPDRASLRKATALLREAGWSVQDGQLRNAEGAPFEFEILLTQGAAEQRQIVDIYSRALERLGIRPRVSVVDPAQYVQRTRNYDFGMTWLWRALSLSPGNEQWLYWGSQGARAPDTRNLPGVASPAVDATIATMLESRSPEEFTAAARALDRLLTAGRYVIPIWYAPVTRVAHSRHLHYPERVPLYGVVPGFMPEAWWYEE